MEFGVPREIRDLEKRVGLTPAGVSPTRFSRSRISLGTPNSMMCLLEHRNGSKRSYDQSLPFVVGFGMQAARDRFATNLRSWLPSSSRASRIADRATSLMNSP